MRTLAGVAGGVNRPIGGNPPAVPNWYARLASVEQRRDGAAVDPLEVHAGGERAKEEAENGQWARGTLTVLFSLSKRQASSVPQLSALRRTTVICIPA